jgi:hypothetical protein
MLLTTPVPLMAGVCGPLDAQAARTMTAQSAARREKNRDAVVMRGSPDGRVQTVRIALRRPARGSAV